MFTGYPAHLALPKSLSCTLTPSRLADIQQMLPPTMALIPCHPSLSLALMGSPPSSTSLAVIPSQTAAVKPLQHLVLSLATMINRALTPATRSFLFLLPASLALLTAPFLVATPMAGLARLHARASLSLELMASQLSCTPLGLFPLLRSLVLSPASLLPAASPQASRPSLRSVHLAVPVSPHAQATPPSAPMESQLSWSRPRSLVPPRRFQLPQASLAAVSLRHLELSQQQPLRPVFLTGLATLE